MKYFPKRMTISWLKTCYKNGDLTPTEVAKEILNRCEKYNDSNIWIIKPTLQLMKKYIDKLPEDRDNYPLWGIPFAIKDNIDLEDIPTTAACKEYEYIPKESAYVVKKLIQAGAIPIGKTNLDQFATGLVGTRSPYGEVHNSLNSQLISGGSSSGSSVAVSLGMGAFSLGTDTAGSGRVPAALNCIVGYKPSVGAWSSNGVVPACASLDCITTFANNIEDAQQVNLIARGFDSNCCWSKNFEIPDYKLPKKICIAKNTIQFFGPFADVYKQKWENAIERIKHLGIKVELIDYQIFSDAASILYDGPWVAERYSDIGNFINENTEKIFPVTQKIIKSGNNPKHTAASLFCAIHKLEKHKTKTREMLKDAVLIMPTTGGTFTREQVRNNPIETNNQMGLYTNHCNLLDLCAIAVPENTTDFELPFGITIFSLADNESLMLGTAKKFIASQTVSIAVCGLHKKGYALESQLTSLGAYYRKSTVTAQEYRLYKLNTTPIKPGLVHCIENGEEIEVDIFDIPINKLGMFMENVTAPLSIGTIKLKDKNLVKGFLCEEYAVKVAEDITDKRKF